MGGLLGLGLGLSFISVIEIMYFFFVRLFCMSRGNTDEIDVNIPPKLYRLENVNSVMAGSVSSVVTQAESVSSLGNFQREL